MVEVTGLEPAASASRTQRSTKLSHTSINNKSKYLIVVFYNIYRAATPLTLAVTKFFTPWSGKKFDRCDFSHSLFLPQETLVFKATKLSHTSINNKSKYLIVVFITSIALLLRLYVITVRKIDSFIIIYSLPLNVNNFFYKTIIFFKKDA